MQPFAELQTAHRPQDAGRQDAREIPACCSPTTCSKQDGTDLRALPQHERRALLERVVRRHRRRVAAALAAGHAADVGRPRAPARESRARGVEGLMLKQRDARYGVGRTKDVGDVVEVEDRPDDASTPC